MKRSPDRHNISEYQSAEPLGTQLTEGNVKSLLSQEMDAVFVPSPRSGSVRPGPSNPASSLFFLLPSLPAGTVLHPKLGGNRGTFPSP